MISMHVAALVLAVAGGGETVLLDFHADWCGPCRQMEPVVSKLVAAGHPIRKVNVSKEPQLAARYGVQSVPCYVLLVNGKEVDRIVGATGASELQALLAKSRLEPTASRSPVPTTRGQSPDPPLVPVSFPGAPTQDTFGSGWNDQRGPVDQDTAGQHQVQSGTSATKLLESAVRLTIEDRTGSSYGTGTIIDARQGEALIVTCGHIFRESQGKGKISVDLFGAQPVQKIEGRLVSYDIKRDVGLVSIKPGVPVTAARIAPKGHRLAPGDRVVSIGCDHGDAPTVRESKVNSLNKFLGPKNVQVAGQPVQGRSGGGLFDSHGYVVGVCNAADPADNEGLFAAVETIQEELDRTGLAMLYQAPQGGSIENNMTPGRALPTAGLPSEMRQVPATLADLTASQSDSEVIFIIRSKSDPKSNCKVVVLDHVSPAFLERLAAEQKSPQLTSLEVPHKMTGKTCPLPISAKR